MVIEKNDVIETTVDLPLTRRGTKAIVLAVFPKSSQAFIFDNDEGYTVPLTAIKKIIINDKIKNMFKKNAETFLEYFNKLKIDIFANKNQRYSNQQYHNETNYEELIKNISDEDIGLRITQAVQSISALVEKTVDEIIVDFIEELEIPEEIKGKYPQEIFKLGTRIKKDIIREL